MAIKTTFNKIIANNTSNRITEVTLIDDLITAIKRCYPCYTVSLKAHQDYVKFQHPTKMVKRELCDIFLVLKFKNYYRFSFIQNKKNKRLHYNGLGRFDIDFGQHYLLTQKPTIIYHNKRSNILKRCRFETVTDYAVFYKDRNGQYDCDLSSAKKVCPLSSAETNKFLKTNKGRKTIGHCFSETFINHNLSIREGVSYLNLDDIERCPYFGEPIFFKDIEQEKKVEIVLKHNFVCHIVNSIINDDKKNDDFKWLKPIDLENWDNLNDILDDDPCEINIKNLIIINCENREDDIFIINEE